MSSVPLWQTALWITAGLYFIRTPLVKRSMILSELLCQSTGRMSLVEKPAKIQLKLVKRLTDTDSQS